MKEEKLEQEVGILDILLDEDNEDPITLYDENDKAITKISSNDVNIFFILINTTSPSLTTATAIPGTFHSSIARWHIASNSGGMDL